MELRYPGLRRAHKAGRRWLHHYPTAAGNAAPARWNVLQYTDRAERAKPIAIVVGADTRVSAPTSIGTDSNSSSRDLNPHCCHTRAGHRPKPFLYNMFLYHILTYDV